MFPHLVTATDVPRLVKTGDVSWDDVDAAFCCLPHATTQVRSTAAVAPGKHNGARGVGGGAARRGAARRSRQVFPKAASPACEPCTACGAFAIPAGVLRASQVRTG